MGEALRTIAFKVSTASCVNSFGDEQLAVESLISFSLRLCNTHTCVSTLALKKYLSFKTWVVSGSIVDTNFTVGTIFGVWPGDKLTRVTGGDQVAEAMGIYGPKTTYVLAVKGFPRTHEFLLLDEGKWQHVKETTEINEGKMFSPGNLRTTFDNSEYSKLIDYYVKEKYTLRYTGGMVPDVNQAKLRLLFEVAPLGLLIENAGGFSSDGYTSVLDKTIVNLEDRIQVAYGSKNEIIRFEETLYGTSRLKNVPIGVTA
ncbi:unnamed protein product [Eruca vesicaria subsp. sativa]|uniref:Uncharacterized protein n=1 Tax=Eruca vesicaria subsp. sativa TaxID=29727 RepID=A0ABC8LWD0_ERUVS|nr:unnamed protein product [Eruca vesicaria subsp. sativa]